MKRCIYLNNAATTYPKPPEVLEAVASLLAAPPVHHARAGFQDPAGDVLAACRQRLAALFNAPDPDRIAFSSGSTESLNLAIHGLPLTHKEVVTTVVEHNSVLRPLKTLERRGLLDLVLVPCDESGFVAPEAIKKALTSRSGAVVVNHASNVTGVPNDLEAIGGLCGGRGIPFIVDASQSAGVHAIDVQGMHIDILAFTGHKSLYGIPGIGGAYIREGLEVQPLKVGGTGVRSDYLFQPEDGPLLYEAGTQNLPGVAALNAGLAHITSRGVDRIRQRKEELVQLFLEGLSGRKGLSLHPPASARQRTTMVSLNVDGMDPADVGYVLEHGFGIVVRSGLHCAPLIHRHLGTHPRGSVRISPSHFTSEEDMEALSEALGQTLQMAA